MYSRLSSVEERKNIRNAIFFGISTIVAVAILFFAGIPLLGKFTALISDIGKGSKQISSQDTTPPAPPRFNQFPDFTNQKNITLTGASETAANVKLTFNGKEQNSLSDKNGNFTFNLDLKDGDNIFSAIAIDTSGNISQKTKYFTINYDAKSPDLSIDSPSDGSTFLGSKQRQVTIQGTTGSEAKLTINDRIISVDDNGKFQYTTTLNDGENTFNIKSIDQAGNVNEKSLTLNFTS
jgi:hypothetical protein